MRREGWITRSILSEGSRGSASHLAWESGEQVSVVRGRATGSVIRVPRSRAVWSGDRGPAGGPPIVSPPATLPRGTELGGGPPPQSRNPSPSTITTLLGR